MVGVAVYERRDGYVDVGGLVGYNHLTREHFDGLGVGLRRVDGKSCGDGKSPCKNSRQEYFG